VEASVAASPTAWADLLPPRLHRCGERGIQELPAHRAAGRFFAVEPFAVGVGAHPEQSCADGEVVKSLSLAPCGDGVEAGESVAVLAGGEVVGRDAELGPMTARSFGCRVLRAVLDPRDVGVGRAGAGDLSLRQATLKPQAADALPDGLLRSRYGNSL
jgi:hypothetical protein